MSPDWMGVVFPGIWPSPCATERSVSLPRAVSRVARWREGGRPAEGCPVPGADEGMPKRELAAMVPAPASFSNQVMEEV
jgi:hypothetical protein